jgi:hypothetical protein
MFTAPKIIKGLPITCLNNMYKYRFVQKDRCYTAQSNFNLMNALEKASLNEILFRLITGIIEVIERQM